MWIRNNQHFIVSRCFGDIQSHSSTYEDITGQQHRDWLSNSSQSLITDLGIDQSKRGSNGSFLEIFQYFPGISPH
jgi:hypothetical protein